MGLIDWIMGFAVGDPTDDWPPHRSVAAVIDLRDASLSGVAIGHSMDAIRRVFGRPDRRGYAKRYSFPYAESGVELEIDGGEVVYFAVVLEPTDYDNGLRGVSCDLIGPNGDGATLSGESNVESLRPFLGDPGAIDDEDDDESVEFYSFDACAVEVETSPDGCLRRINVMRREGK